MGSGSAGLGFRAGGWALGVQGRGRVAHLEHVVHEPPRALQRARDQAAVLLAHRVLSGPGGGGAGGRGAGVVRGAGVG